MAVQVVVLYRPHVLPLDKVGHPVAHPARDVGDHGAVPGLQAVERARHGGVASHQPSVVAWPSAVVHGEGLVAGALVEGAQQRHFGRDRDGHVVLDGVEGSEDEVEDADGVTEAFRELLDDDGEAVFLVGWGWLVGSLVVTGDATERVEERERCERSNERVERRLAPLCSLPLSIDRGRKTFSVHSPRSAPKSPSTTANKRTFSRPC